MAATLDRPPQLGPEISPEELVLLRKENQMQQIHEEEEQRPIPNSIGSLSARSPSEPASQNSTPTATPSHTLTPNTDLDKSEMVGSLDEKGRGSGQVHNEALSPDLDDDTDDGVEDQDGAQAVLQPAMSAAASHYTSPLTPAVEKAAALEKAPGGGLFGVPPIEEEEDRDADDDEDLRSRVPPSLMPGEESSAKPVPVPVPMPMPHAAAVGTTRPTAAASAPARDSMPPPSSQSPLSPARRSQMALGLGKLPARADLASRRDMPSPWSSGPKDLIIDKDSLPVQVHGQGRGQAQSWRRPSRGVLESAFGPTRNRSRSAGQDALKRLQKALPSFSTSSHLLSSFPSSFFSSSSTSAEKSNPALGTSHGRVVLGSPNPGHGANSTARSASDDYIQASASLSNAESTPRHAPAQPPTATHSLPRRSNSIQSRRSSTAMPSRPPALRRVTSDESILYHSLSRASSLGDDDQFQDVRAMVNMRLQAIKESLPEVPNFKMPSLPKIHAPSFISMNSFGSSDGAGASAATPAATTAAAALNRSAGLDRDSAAPARDGYTDLDRALEGLTGDIVIMGGLRGSVLRFADPPHQQCWAPVKLGFNMRKVNLEVGLEDEDEERMEETIIPSGMLCNIGPVDISRRLFKKLRNCDNARAGKLRVWDYGYDWRLSPALLSRKLREFLQGLPSNQPGVAPQSRGAVVIAHSLGGMITRHAVNQRPDLFAGVLYAGVPQRCINILGPLRNGDVVLLNEKLLSAQVNFSMRTSFVFLPEDGFCFVDKNTQEEYPVDFFDPQEWVKWHLSPCVNPALPSSKPGPSATYGSPSLSSLLPTSLRARAESRSEKWFGSATLDPSSANALGIKDRSIAPQMYPGSNPDSPNLIQDAPSAAAAESSTLPTANRTAAPSTPTPTPPSDPERTRYMEYLTRVLTATKKFRTEVVHRPDHQSSNAYPPLAVLYGKSTPTVYAAQVNGREGIPCADAYDDLLFRAGDGVVLAKEAMLPEGYSVVKGGRVCTERGHITMLADMEAIGKALNALIRGRRKGIGLGVGESGTR